MKPDNGRLRSIIARDVSVRAKRLRRSTIRMLLCIAIGGVVFGSTYGFAARLDSHGSTLGAGMSAVSACQDTPITASFSSFSEPDTTANPSTVTVTLRNIDTTSAGCGGGSYAVDLLGAAGALLGRETGMVQTHGATLAVVFQDAHASDVTGVRVAISR